MGKVSNILRTKSKTILSVIADTVVYDAIELMCDHNVSAVVVMDNERLAGIFTERDYARKLILKGKASKETLIGEVMTEDLITVTPDTSIDECMRLMTGKLIRHLPVVEEDRLVGIISIGDVVKYIIDEQKFIIENMEHYITGS
ncbi:MAG: CBS domain-containing protein [Segetibacter sp.]|jgi:CBS domain-containing protein|nr:CBS domain-containing protein [Segetibacter sp.]